MPYLTKEQKDTVDNTHGHSRHLQPLELMVINNTTAAALVEYKMRERHTLELIRQRASRADVPLEPKLFAHLQLLTTGLFHYTLHVPHVGDPDNIDQQLNQIVAAVLAIKVILSEEQVKAMMG